MGFRFMLRADASRAYHSQRLTPLRCWPASGVLGGALCGSLSSSQTFAIAPQSHQMRSFGSGWRQRLSGQSAGGSDPRASLRTDVQG